ncbi:MAG: type I-U CRISPR-associated helicase/endonuclease Cas3 [Acidobacteria bacterium]|nr:type I-U CRISPR-associated helicase/endonuclease Cas3 [Acidobacteriota bacterium]
MRVSFIDFGSAFKALTEHDPFPWQRRLFDMMSDGKLPAAVDIPTGLGKTAIMAIWLLARAAGARLPRRLVYVVDRRAVVDQATDFAEELRERLGRPALELVRRDLGLAGRELPISTLRGQHVDNREWLEDPAAPAIVVGTVDMVGSRLLFEGYGVSRRMRPYQAGLMGCDTLVLLDEAHLSGPFERLLRTIEEGRRASTENDAESVTGRFAGSCASVSLLPSFRVLPLSATLGKAPPSAAAPFTLDDGEDRQNEIVQARLGALKTLTIEDLGPKAPIEDVLAERAWDLALRKAAAGNPARMLVYCDRRKVAESVAAGLRRRIKLARSGAAVILFVGGRRVYERQDAADDLRERGLLGSGGVAARAPAFVVATSAGEVGVDLDADHMVCDLVAWERMVQRLGRVNRRGSGKARVLVIDQGPPETKSETRVDRHQATRALLEALPRSGDGHQAGPAALQNTARSSEARTAAASTPPPLHPELTRPLIDAWAMTSLAEHGGRPEVDPWLRGWTEEQIPQTTVVWRRWLPVRVAADGAGSRSAPLHGKAVDAFFEIAAPQAVERLETETPHVVDWLRKRARKLSRTLPAESHDGRGLEVRADSEGARPDAGGTPAATSPPEPTSPLHLDAPAAFVLDRSGKPVDGDGENEGVLTLRAVNRLTVKALERRLADQVLVVDARIGGLNDGLLDVANGKPVPTAEDNWGRPEEWGETGRNGAATTGAPTVRVRLVSHDERDRMAAREEVGQGSRTSDAWRESWAEPYCVSAADLPLTWLTVEKRRAAAPDEDSRAMASLQRLDAHQEMAAQEAARIAEDLGLGKEYQAMLVAAARHHDEGKRSPRWQRAFNAPPRGGPYAKTPGPMNRHVLDGYRHELQSMLDAEAGGLDGLDRSDPRFDLALHLIAAHHGNARPGIGIDGCDGLPPTAAARKAYAVGLRFARLQRQWGPWGVAWWEALLRAADQRASRALDEAARRSRTGPDAHGLPTTAPEPQLGLFPPSTEAG